jgi:hypothetical protein
MSRIWPGAGALLLISGSGAAAGALDRTVRPVAVNF